MARLAEISLGIWKSMTKIKLSSTSVYKLITLMDNQKKILVTQQFCSHINGLKDEVQNNTYFAIAILSNHPVHTNIRSIFTTSSVTSKYILSPTLMLCIIVQTLIIWFTIAQCILSLTLKCTILHMPHMEKFYDMLQ